MNKHCTGRKYIICIASKILLLVFLFLLSGKLSAQVKDSSITAIYTNFKNYWATSTTTPSLVQPDSSHNLLAFTFRGTTYSTGVNNATLNTRLGSTNYAPAVFKALPVNSISGTVASGGATYLATAIKNDGDSTTFGYKSPFPNIHIADVLTDGKFGLDLGTGVTNLPKGARISFAIQNLNTKASTDTIPDLVFTQIADPTGNVPDTIFFYDVNGNVVGNKKLVNWSTVNKLGTYKLDLYAFQTGVSCNTASISSSFQANGTRDIRMVAFLITEFGIVNSDSTAKVKGITIATSGTSDQAFIAYNTSILNLNVPTITTQPASQTFCSNATTSATFSVAASSGTTMTYQWKKNGANISGATSSSYTASSLTIADTANAYSVTVTNSVGSVNSDNAYITYTIVTQPSNQYVATGSPATFTVKASGATAFQWYKGGIAISGATSPTYTISPTTLAMSGSSYTVAVTYSGGTCTSSSATLTVENLPSITTQPTAQVLCNNSITVATFSVTASSTSAMSYQWYKNNVIISGATFSSYAASGLTYADTSATFKVIVTNGVGATTSSSVGFKYLVLTQPVSQYLQTGSSVTFSVTASSIATGYQWQKNGSNISGATSRTYAIPSVALSDSGSYAVVVSYSGNSCTSNAATLRVENALVITTQPSLQVLCNSSSTSATYSVAATSASPVTYQWYKNGTSIPGAILNSYTASGLTYSDTTSTYYVVLTNGVGSTTSSSAGLKYLILTQPAGRYIVTGSSVTFSVSASTVATGYQWQKGGVTIGGATSRTYTIASASLSDAGSYTAIVYYAGGSCTSNAATLTVENIPVVTTQPSLQVLCNGSVTSATFNVVAISVSSLGYQWYKNGTVISGATSSSYTASGLTYADTMSTYYVVLTNGIGTATSLSTGIKYLILAQPTSLYLATGATATFTAITSSTVATGYQWQKASTNINGATSAVYTNPSVALADSGSYNVIVSYAGGTCASNPATLTVENLPVVTTQPKLRALCNTSATSATYSVVATSTSAVTYQWYKNGSAISGATLSSYTATGVSLADTNNTYYVRLTNGVGFTNSNSVGLTYLILSQPTPATSYLATGNTVTFTAAVSSAATAFQWKKDGVSIFAANALSYKIDTVTTASAGSYRLFVSSAGNSCNSSAGVLTTSVVLYSKASGNISDAATWGVQVNGTGSTPLDFTRAEHTFVVANRDTAATTKNITIAGTYDVGNGITTISNGTTFEAGRIIRSLSSGSFAGTATSALLVHGKSDLYFDTAHKVMQTLTIATTDTVTLHTALNMTAGAGHGIVKINAGVLNTSDLLTLKSDSFGTAAIGSSLGTIIGKVTVERFVPAHRAWRIFSSPVAAAGAPTIHTAWQEGAVNSVDNPHPGFGTHITYGTVENGFDQNPQKSFSMKVYSSAGKWIGVPATNATLVTDYPAYFFFIRGNRAYDISTTKTNVPPMPTTLRTTGNIRQGTQADIPVSSTGYTLVGNPYASPVDFESMYQHSQNITHYFWMWNPNMGSNLKGTGAYVIAYWDGTGYSTTPALPDGSQFRFIQANQGFFVQSDGSNAHVSFSESDKDTANTITPFGREGESVVSKLAINLDVFNTDSTTDIVDGVAYLFSDEFNNGIDKDDILKFSNLNENLSISSNGKLLTLEQRNMPAGTDSLRLSLTSYKSTKYQFTIIPVNISSDLYLFDRYLNTTTPISLTDTSRIVFSVDKTAPSKVSNRFVIVTKASVVLPVTFTSINATIKAQTAQVNWSITNEAGIRSYEIERSANGNSFSKIGEVPASGNKQYNFTDSKPLNGINYYRVKSISLNGETSCTSIANVVFGNDSRSYVAVYPNPVTGSHCKIELHNKPAGKYVFTFISSKGQTVFTTVINATEGDSIQPVTLPSLAKGAYDIQVTGTGTKETIKMVCL